MPLRSPTGEVVPHPVLDVPVEGAAYSRSRGVDWVVFGVTAVIAVAFLLWGFLNTDSLATASDSALVSTGVSTRSFSTMRPSGSTTPPAIFVPPMSIPTLSTAFLSGRRARDGAMKSSGA